MATQPAPLRAARYDALIRALLAAGVWTKLDALYLLAAADAATALTNLRQASYGLTAVNSPTFEADRGYTGNGTTQYLSTGFNPSTAGGQWVQNSATSGVWKRTHSTSAVAALTGAPMFYGGPGNPHCLFYRDQAGGWLGASLNASGAGAPSGPATGDTGLIAMSRTSSTAVAGYINGSVELSAGHTSTGLPNGTLTMLGIVVNATELSQHQISAGVIGAGLDAAEHAALYNAVHSYLQAVGAAE